ncbi:hypothetical protein D3C76_907480 [compost metagenome]
MIAAQRQHRLAQVGQARRLARLPVVDHRALFPLGADVGAGPGARGQEAFGDQLIEGIEDGDPRQRQLLAQGARRRQAHAALDAAAEDLLANLQVKLAVQGDGAGTVQLDGRQQQTCGGFHDGLVWTECGWSRAGWRRGVQGSERQRISHPPPGTPRRALS